MTTVVALDYPGRRDEGRVAELLDLAPAGLDVVQPLPVRPAEPVAWRYAHRVAELVRPHRATAVVGYCLTASLSRWLVTMSAPGPPPLLVLLDPAQCAAEVVAREYQQVRRQFGAPGESGEVEVTAEALRRAPEDVVDAMRAELEQRATEAMLDEGLEGAEASDAAEALVVRYTEWLAHIVAGHDERFPPWQGKAVTLLSRDSVPTAAGWLALSSEETIRMPCTHAELLRDPATAKEVVRLITANPG